MSCWQEIDNLSAFAAIFIKCSTRELLIRRSSILPLQRDQFSTSGKRISEKRSKLKEIDFIDGILFYREFWEYLKEMRSLGYLFAIGCEE